MERVPVARYSAPDVAELAAGFLRGQGFDAVSLDQSGKGSQIATVLVVRSEAASAHALLRRAERGEQVNAGSEPGLTSDIAEDFMKALHGSGDRGVGTRWRDALPLAVITGALLLMLVIGLMIAAF